MVKVEWSPTENEQKELNAEGLNGQMVVKFDVDSSQSTQQILVIINYYNDNIMTFVFYLLKLLYFYV